MADEISTEFKVPEIINTRSNTARSFFDNLPDAEVGKGEDGKAAEAEAKEEGLFGEIQDAAEKLDSVSETKSPEDVWEDEGDEEEAKESEEEESEEESEEDSEKLEAKESDEEEEDADKVEESEVEKKTKEALKAVNKPREVTAIVNGKEQKILSNTIFKQKIDGKMVDVDLEHLLRVNASSSVNTKRADELTTKFKEIESYEDKLLEREEFVQAAETRVQNTLNNFVSLVKDGNAIQAVSHLLSTVTDPYPIILALRSELVEKSQAYLELPPEERARLDAIEQANYYKYKAQKDMELMEVSRKEKMMREETEALKQKYSLTNKKLKEYVSNIKKLSDEGVVSVKEITPAVIEDYHQHVQRTDLVLETVKRIAPKFLSDQDFIKRAYQVAATFQPTKEKFEALVRQLKEEEGSQSDKAPAKKERTLSGTPSVKPKGNTPKEKPQGKLQGPSKRYRFSFEK